MKLRVLYFAWVRERVGCEAEEVATDARNVAELIADLSARGAGYALAFGESGSIRAAVNQVLAGADEPIKDGDEVAFFPPMTGG